MSNRKSPVPLPHGPPRTIGSVEQLIQHATGHARNRLLNSCETIGMIAGLALRWNKPKAPSLSLKGAWIQDGSAGRGEQAAHVLPGQLLINGKAPWTFARNDKEIVAWLARFEVTSAVPTSFNTADSAAESAGLKTAFVQACERAWTRVAGGDRNLTATYAEFLADANRAFQKAELMKSLKDSAAANQGDKFASDSRALESVILRCYQVNGVTAEEANRKFPLSKFMV